MFGIANDALYKDNIHYNTHYQSSDGWVYLGDIDLVDLYLQVVDNIPTRIVIIHSNKLWDYSTPSIAFVLIADTDNPRFQEIKHRIELYIGSVRDDYYEWFTTWSKEYGFNWS